MLMVKLLSFLLFQRVLFVNKNMKLAEFSILTLFIVVVVVVVAAAVFFVFLFISFKVVIFFFLRCID